MEKKIKEADLLSQIGLQAEKKNQFEKALEYYSEAGQIYFSLSLSSTVKDLKKKRKEKAENILKRGNEVKKRLRQDDMKKAIKTKSAMVSNTKTEFTLIPGCIDLYSKLGFEYYRQASDKASAASKKIMLKSAINAHIAEAEIKKAVVFI